MIKLLLLLCLLGLQSTALSALNLQCDLMGDCPRHTERISYNSDMDLLGQDEFASLLVANDLVRPINTPVTSDGFGVEWSRPQYHIPLGLDGSDLSIYGVAAGYILGVVLQNGEVKSATALLAKTALITGIVAQAAKRIFHRERPNQDNGPYQFHGPGLEGSHLSIPVVIQLPHSHLLLLSLKLGDIILGSSLFSPIQQLPLEVGREFMTTLTGQVTSSWVLSLVI